MNSRDNFASNQERPHNSASSLQGNRLIHLSACPAACVIGLRRPDLSKIYRDIGGVMSANFVLRAGLGLFAASYLLISHAGELVSIPTRASVTQGIYIEEGASTSPSTAATSAAHWIVVLFAGDDGAVDLREGGPARMRGNFLLRSSAYWNTLGAIPVVFDAPSDYARGMDDSFRLSEAQAQDVAAAVALLRKKYPDARIALVGTSRGSISVGNILKREPQVADAYVMTSPVTLPGRGGPGLAGVSWEHGAARVLVLSNKGDGCVVSPFWSAKKMAEAGGFDFIAVSSDAGASRMPEACKANSPHGYLGIETQVLDAVNGWLGAAPSTN